ncbi:MAG: PQQ-binding-like beta-propeller repeat protein, partial [Steroidobacteraceae bacterium]
GDKERPVIGTGGKVGIFALLEAATGRYLGSFDLGIQNLILRIDAKTGAKTIDPQLLPHRSATVTVCPHSDGGKNWIPSSYNPNSKVLFVQAAEICMDMVPVEGTEKAALSSGVRFAARPPPHSDGMYGRLQAINLVTKTTKWVKRQRAPWTSGLLATGGGLVFGADLERTFAAYDEDTGRELWRLRLNDVSNSAPITYQSNGKQYVAVTVGHGRLSVARGALTPEIRLPASPAPTLWVFELSTD